MGNALKKEGAVKDLKEIYKVLADFGVRAFVVYGALLGHYRDKNFLPGDDDVDLAIIDPIPYEKRKAIGWFLCDIGFMPQPIAFNVFGRMEQSEPGYNGDGETGIIVCQRNFKFTIFFFKLEECGRHGLEYVCIPKLGAMKLISTPATFYSHPGIIKIAHKKYLAPSPVEDYLSFTYFNNWKDRTDRRHGQLYDAMHQ